MLFVGELRLTSRCSSQGFWQVASTSWTLNGAAYERRGNTAILDTGTTLMLLDDDVVEAIYGGSLIRHFRSSA